MITEAKTTHAAQPHLARPNNKKLAPATRGALLAISTTPGISTHGIAHSMPTMAVATISKALANLRMAGYVTNAQAGSGKSAQWLATAKGLTKAAEVAPAQFAMAAPTPSVSSMSAADAAARRDTLRSMPNGGMPASANKSAERMAVEDCLALAGAKGRTRAELCRITGLDDDAVHRVLRHLVSAQRGDSVGGIGPDRHWRLLSAVARDEAARAKVAVARVCNAGSKGNYDGSELRANPGITSDRFEAFRLPSLVNGVRVPPKRITAMCTGPAGPVGGLVSVNVRFAK